jgi:hypothetical protein
MAITIPALHRAMFVEPARLCSMRQTAPAMPDELTNRKRMETT